MTDQPIERRLKLYRIDEHCILDYLRRGDNWPEQMAFATGIKGPPDGCRVEDTWYDPARRGWMVAVSHPEFAEVPMGEHIPFANEVMQVNVVLLQRGPDGAYRDVRAGSQFPGWSMVINDLPTRALTELRDGINQLLYDRNK